MRRTAKIVAVLVVVAIIAVAAYEIYGIYLAPSDQNTCVPYLRTDCGHPGNDISYNPATGDITVPSVGQNFGSTWYNVAVAYVNGNPLVPRGAYFQADSSDFTGNMLNSGHDVTVHSLNATGAAAAGQTYNGSLWIAYTTSAGGSPCSGTYQVSGCQYAEIGTITLQG